MKRFLILFLALTPIICLSQAKIGMGHSYTVTPAAATSSSVGVLFGDSVHVYSYAKNSGNVGFAGTLHMRIRRDTLNGVRCDSIALSVSLQPNDSILTHLVFAPSSGVYAFKSGGNGNTIVVWPFVVDPSVLYGDSIKPVIWISGTTGIREFDISSFNLYPNPVTHYLNIKPLKQRVYKQIMVYDAFARKIKELHFEEQIDLSDLSSGSYWIIISTDDKQYRIPFIKEGTVSK